MVFIVHRHKTIVRDIDVYDCMTLKISVKIYSYFYVVYRLVNN